MKSFEQWLDVARDAAEELEESFASLNFPPPLTGSCSSFIGRFAARGIAGAVIAAKKNSTKNR